MHKYLRLLRVEQWYKNTIIFIPLIFTGQLFKIPAFFLILKGFILLSLTSSSCYIINDIVDREKDLHHPEKKTRPVASGEISVKRAFKISMLLLSLTLIFGFILSKTFFILQVILTLSLLAYTFYLKTKALIDIHVIAFNYLVRAIAGAVLLHVPVSPWLITSIFFLALYLAVGKRRAELMLLKDKAVENRATYKVYTPHLLDILSTVIATTLLFSYILYTFMAHKGKVPYLMLTIPFASFMLFRYLYFISSGHIVARKTHYIFKDRQMMIALAIWFIIVVVTFSIFP